MTSFTKDLCLALADPAVILALGMIIENKNAELLSNFDGRIQDLEEKVKVRDNRISSLEYELQSIKAQATRSIDGLDELEQYSRLNSVWIQHPQWVESPTEDCVSLVIDYAKSNNMNLIPGDFDACHRIGSKENSKIRPILVKFVRRDHARSLRKTRAKQRYDKTRIL